MSTAARVKSLLPKDVRMVIKPAMRRASQGTSTFRPPPDFLVIGTKRGGTTSTWNWLLDHPGVLPLVPGSQGLKSSHYFTINYAKPFTWFRGFFPLASTRSATKRRLGYAPVTGEASPYYLFDPRVADRVATALPAVKIIVVLRDPVERAYSHFQERTKEGVETLSFRDALAAEPDRLAGELERMEREPTYYSEAHDWFAYRERGVYGAQLARWQNAVPADRLLVLQSERLYGDPGATIRQISAFLGLPHVPLAKAPRHNYLPAAPMPDDLRVELRAYYEEHDAGLPAIWGHDPHWGRH